MAYDTYDKPGEFFNTAPTTAAFAVTTSTITLGCSNPAAPTTNFLTNLTVGQANLGSGSTAQVIFGLVDGVYQRFNSIPTADKPTKFNITRSGFTDEATGEIVYNYAITCRVTPGSLDAVNA